MVPPLRPALPCARAGGRAGRGGTWRRKGRDVAALAVAVRAVRALQACSGRGLPSASPLGNGAGRGRLLPSREPETGGLGHTRRPEAVTGARGGGDCAHARRGGEGKGGGSREPPGEAARAGWGRGRERGGGTRGGWFWRGMWPGQPQRLRGCFFHSPRAVTSLPPVPPPRLRRPEICRRGWI